MTPFCKQFETFS